MKSKKKKIMKLKVSVPANVYLVQEMETETLHKRYLVSLEVKSLELASKLRLGKCEVFQDYEE